MVGPAVQVEVNEFTDDGWSPYSDWLNSLDRTTKARVLLVVNRLQYGNFGDSKSVGEGVHELRLHFGSGYRVYYGKRGNTVVVLLGGGDKASQDTDIVKAKAIWVRINSTT